MGLPVRVCPVVAAGGTGVSPVFATVRGPGRKSRPKPHGQAPGARPSPPAASASPPAAGPETLTRSEPEGFPAINWRLSAATPPVPIGPGTGRPRRGRSVVCHGLCPCASVRSLQHRTDEDVSARSGAEAVGPKGTGEPVARRLAPILRLAFRSVNPTETVEIGPAAAVALRLGRKQWEVRSRRRAAGSSQSALGSGIQEVGSD